ncbi:hypothetical protein K504DRAFT_377614 [Pleomassaria siparia CBS 279.74]|uniref:HMG box domain-containing protein n=1 Tax=Pleomassaria siparia CBS 279.74 TaxID=1314801 RepID=A0A6G1KCL2_9PLEO|nr:hypothetical protein K504DRAFT_377614 [Pleomassaria siparia CBS 279.74]
MSDLAERLERLGLTQYLDLLVAEGFDSWATVLDITESDLNSLNVKLGHRRKLQRAIAEFRGQSGDRPLLIKNTSADGSYRSDDSAQEAKPPRPSEPPVPGAAGTSTKRKYRRHPKADEYAPERPPSAYVIFSNQVRETLKGQELSFTEIAKVVGERWQVLPADAREACERQANTAKEKYYAELTEYKKTPQYEVYQKYLEDFKAKHAAPQKGNTGTEGKRSKLETETSTPTSGSWSRSDEQLDRPLHRRIGSAQPDPFAHHRMEASPPIGPSRLPLGPSYPSNSASPAMRPLSGLNSPRIRDQYSPTSASPRSAILHKENSFDMHANAMAREIRAHPDSSMPYPPGSYVHALGQVPSASSPVAFGSYHQAPVDLPSRRSFREPSRLPGLSHEDTTLSSNSGDGGYITKPLIPPLLPMTDVQKSSRMLPQPIPSLGATPSPLDRHPLPVSSPQPPPDFRSNSLAALLRAGELAREANDEEMARDGSP